MENYKFIIHNEYASLFLTQDFIIIKRTYEQASFSNNKINPALEGEYVIPYNEILRVEHKTSFSYLTATGFLKLVLFDTNKYVDSLYISFNSFYNKDMKKIISFIEEKIKDNSISSTPIPEQIIQMKALLDNGAITEEEFISFKDKLLK